MPGDTYGHTLPALWTATVAVVALINLIALFLGATLNGDELCFYVFGKDWKAKAGFKQGTILFPFLVVITLVACVIGLATMISLTEAHHW